MWGFIIIVIIILVIIVRSGKQSQSQYKFKRYKKTGIEGERFINHILKNISDQVGGTTFNDIMLESNGNTCQIDNMLLTRKALYVIESKDYSGWIFGSENNTYWRQTFTHYKARTSGNNYIKSGVSKYSFYNPIKQNQTHINMLKSTLKTQKAIPIYNIVVFGKNATIKKLEHSFENYVITVSFLKDTVFYIENQIENELESHLQRDIIDNILFLDIKDPTKRQQHIDSIQTKYKID